MTREQKYKQQMERLGTYDEIFDPEINTLCQLERELQIAKKAWSRTAPPDGKPSVLDDRYAVIQKIRGEILQHRDALGLTPKGMHRLRGVQADGPDQKDLLASKLDSILDGIQAGKEGFGPDLTTLLQDRDPFTDQPGFDAAQQISDRMDGEDYDLKQAVAEDMG